MIFVAAGGLVVTRIRLNIALAQEESRETSSVLAGVEVGEV